MIRVKQVSAALLFAVSCIAILLPMGSYAANDKKVSIGKVVAQAIRPVMEEYGVPGMAVGIVINGQNYVYEFGVASKATGKSVTSKTLFEIGSVSKTLTATLVSYAQVKGDLSLSDMVSKYVPSLRGSSFGKMGLLNLGTYTSGGLPLQVPSNITNNAELMAYFQQWRPIYAPGTYRTYSNLSIGMLGIIAARSMNKSFIALMEDKLLPELGMNHTYLDVPKAQMKHYAQGYTQADKPIRMAPGVLAPEAYGIRSTAADMLRFVEANMDMLHLHRKLQQAITDTHTGYYQIQIGAMTQDLIWEQYHYPFKLKKVLAGNSAKVIFGPLPVTKLNPPLRPQDDVLINRTGSTNGFAAYVAFIPERKIGIVLLSNKNYSINTQVTVAYEILTQLHNERSKNSG